MTASTTSPSKWQRANTFLKNLHDRVEHDNGAKAILKRALSGEPHHLRRTYPFLLPYLKGIPEYQQNIWMQVACLSVYYCHPDKIAIREEQKNFGQSCQQLAIDKASSGEYLSQAVERRVQSLLDTSLTDIWTPMTALIRQIKTASVEIPIDFPRLIYDLCRWEHPDQYIQDQWARSFWQVPHPDLENNEEETS